MTTHHCNGQTYNDDSPLQRQIIVAETGQHCDNQFSYGDESALRRLLLPLLIILSKIHSHMSKGKVQQVMEHNLLPLEFQIRDEKDFLYNGQRCYQLKILTSLQILSAV